MSFHFRQKSNAALLFPFTGNVPTMSAAQRHGVATPNVLSTSPA